MKKFLFLSIIFLTIITFFIFVVVFFIWREIKISNNYSFREEKIFSIEKGQNIFDIAKNLEKEKIIKNRFLFILYTFINNNYKKIQAGKYLISSNLNIPQIVEKFVLGDTLKIKITIPEGFNISQIEEEFRKSFKGIDFEKFHISDFKKDFDFLSNMPDDASLEGFLFPDTYFFDPDSEEREIIGAFLKNFNKKVVLKINDKIKNTKKPLFDIIIMASLIEKEVRTIEDKKIVSGILWKRLKADIPLQVDATITYITGKNTTKISIEETQIDSLYNTYKYKGLPKGPIANPGIDSIIAAIEPFETNYWYYLSDRDGKTIFSVNYKQHLEAIKKHLR